MIGKQEVISMISKMAEHGHPPKNGCSSFSYGYEESIGKLKSIYLEKRLAEMGSSAEKFVIGPYGSGKTHFCRQILETGDRMGFLTAEVQLNKNVDFTKPLIVYKQFASQIKLPRSNKKGMRDLIASCYENMKKFLEEETGEGSMEFLRAWINDLNSVGLDPSFARVVKKALNGYAAGGYENEIFEGACRWLEGEVVNRQVLDLLGESRVPVAEEALHGQRAMNSVFQFIKESRYPGTIVVFDEAEQSFSVNKRKRQQILSMLQSGINNIADLNNGAVLILYALTLDIADHFNEFHALKGRLDDPIGGKSFFEGDVHAPKILLDYSQKSTPWEHLRGMGERLVDLFYQLPDLDVPVPKEDTLKRVYELAEEISSVDPSPSNRRTMTKSTCYVLIKLYEEGILATEIPPERAEEEVE